MTPEQFYNLDEMEQIETVWEGVMIADRYQEEYHVKLYQIDNLYVEVFYHEEHNFIRKVVPFNDLSVLDIYLKDIKIELNR